MTSFKYVQLETRIRLALQRLHSKTSWTWSKKQERIWAAWKQLTVKQGGVS